KDQKKPASVKQQFAALVKEHDAEQQKIINDYQKAKADERPKLLEKYNSLNKDYAEKVYKLAEDNPKDPAAADALFWVVQNGNGSAVHQKAAEKIATLVAEMPAAALLERLEEMRGGSPAIFDAVLKRAEKDERDP